MLVSESLRIALFGTSGSYNKNISGIESFVFFCIRYSISLVYAGSCDKMEKFRAIKIVYNIGDKVNDRIDYLFLAEFFRMCGLYVGEEYELEQFNPMKELEEKCFDSFICVSEEEEFGEKPGREQLEQENGLVFFNTIRSEVLANRKDELIRMLKADEKKMLLKECLKRIGDKIPIANRIAESELIDVYLNNNIMIRNVNLQYYPKVGNEIIFDAGKGMLQAYNYLDSLNIQETVDDDIRSYEWYAKIWFAVKVNDACEFQRKILAFSPDELAKECEALSAKYPDFSNAIVLQGLCYEHSKDKAMEAIGAFKQALDCERGRCYSNAICYWIGKRYEAYEVREELAKQYYEDAYKKKAKFRNIYKLAIYEKNHRNYIKAEIWFNKIIDALKEKMRNHLADPLELEYAFKSYQQMCLMFYKQCDDNTVKYRKAIEYGKKAIDIREKEIGRAEMYTALYGEEDSDEFSAAKYQDISHSRMDLKNIYRVLISVYNDLREYDLARNYMQKLEKDG